MNFSDNTPLDKILNGLFIPYAERVPYVKTITTAMKSIGIISKQEDIVNDHIAFRTLGVPKLGIASFEKIFLEHHTHPWLCTLQECESYHHRNVQ